ncbi:hypothetical protein ABIC16_002216 [Sphingomonas sp. PvP055]
MMGYTVDASRPKARMAGVEFDVFSSTQRLRAHVSYETLGGGRESRTATEWETLVREMPGKLQALVDEGQRNGRCGTEECLM